MQEQQVEEAVLGGPDSKFLSLGDCKVHFTKDSTSRIPSARSGPATAVHCYHGFGANTGSWQYLRQRLASALDAQVTAHDMPGFGLTQRLAAQFWASSCKLLCVQTTLEPSQALAACNVQCTRLHHLPSHQAMRLSPAAFVQF